MLQLGQAAAAGDLDVTRYRSLGLINRVIMKAYVIIPDDLQNMSNTHLGHGVQCCS